jgi:tetratricopeptide (TPR) repeat protein
MRSVHALLLTLVWLMSFGTASAQYKFYSLGVDQYKAGKFHEAIDAFTEFLEKPNHEKNLEAEVYYLRGLSYFKMQEHKKSIADLEQAIKLNYSNKGNIYWFIAISQDKLGYYNDAVDAYGNAIRELQANKEVYVKILLERSLVYQKLERHELAYNDLQKANNIHPGNEAVKKEIERFEKENQAALQAEQAAKREVTRIDKPVAGSLSELYKNEKRYALVIGNSHYPSGIGELKNPLNDATDMAAELKSSSFEVQLLTDATYGQMRAALMKFMEKLNAGERENIVGLFYFAGHGVRQEEENFLVPVDAVIEYPDDIRRYCFPVQHMVLSSMANSNARLNVVILDACRNNPFPSIYRSAGQNGLAEMQKARGSFIAYATAPGSVAIDGTGRNGLYTQEILKAMRIPGLTIEQVFKEVRVNVLKLSNQKQQTWDSSNITGEFYFKFKD